MIINTNMQALITNNSLWSKNRALQKNSKNLSLGTKINTAGDDPAGMAISNKMKSQIAGLEIANRNTNDAVSLIQTTEGALTEVHNMVQRMRELAVQGATDALTDKDRALIQEEINQLVDEIDSVSERTEFNERPLLNDKYDTLTFQIGEKENMELTFDFEKIDSETLGFSKKTVTGTITTVEKIKYKTTKDCTDAIIVCDKALNDISLFRAKLGAMQNRLEKNSNSLDVSTENSKVSLSRMMDTDMAYEMSEYTKNNVLMQSGLAMLAQANQRPNQLLSLLQ